ncbi:hypothetical protein PIB30_036804 [Stylosanthes scabra]|uniref:Uncharacterized protein n=1 Tax=Stylosanthes scabra TaxID=79078 RepID=A0ABU6ZCB9_9FABA|nr:hypothetical protein [Stylosanthes scabra]
MPSSSDDKACKKRRKPKNKDSPKKKSADSKCSPTGINKLITVIIKDNARMAEVEAMDFGNLQYIPEWIVNQEICMYLASKFDLDNNVIKDDVANIEINAEIVERALGLPSSGDEFPEYFPTNSDYEALKKSDDQEEGEGYNKQEAGNNERDDQFREEVIEDEEVIKKWTQIEKELKSQRTMIVYEKKKLTKEPEEEVEKTLKDATEFFMNNFDGYSSEANIQEDLLTANEKKKIYNWVMNALKDSGVQEEMIATFQGYRNLFLLRMEFRCLKLRK